MAFVAKDLFKADDLAQRYSKFRYRFPKSLVHQILELKGDKKPDFWVDVACGPGTSTVQIIGHAKKILGIDISKDQIKYANENINDPSTTFVDGDCYNIPVGDNSVDVITVIQAAHYFDIPKFFNEADRVLKPGGVLALVKMTNPGQCTSSKSLADGVNGLSKYLVDEYGVSESMKIWMDNYKTITLPYEPRHEFHVAEPWSKTYNEIVEVFSTFSHFNNLKNDKKLDFEGALSFIRKCMEDNGVTDSDKSGRHEFMVDTNMIACKKPQ